MLGARLGCCRVPGQQIINKRPSSWCSDLRTCTLARTEVHHTRSHHRQALRAGQLGAGAGEPCR